MNGIINYAELYGVKSGETDFRGAIKRWKESGMKLKHLNINEFKKY